MKVVGYLTLAVLQSVLYGFVLKVLWGWFVVETFHAPELSIPVALGIALIVKYLTSSYSATSKSSLTEQMVYGFIAPVFALIFGAIYHLFV